MTRQWWKRVELPHPAAALAAGGILLFGLHLNETIRAAHQAPVTSTLPQAMVSSGQGQLSPLSPGLTVPYAGSLAPAPGSGGAGSSAGLPPGVPGDPKASAAPLPTPSPVVPPPPAFIGPEVPVRGPQWKGAPLPALSPEVLQAMLDPNAVRRARRLRRLGIVPPVEPNPRQAGGPSLAPATIAARPPLGVPSRTGDPRDGSMTPPATAASPGPGGANPAALPTAPRPRPTTPESPTAAKSGEERGARTKAPQPAPSTAASEGNQAPTRPAGEEGTSAASAKSEGDNSPSPLRPISLQAQPDRSQLAYRVGEWVALRYFASHPAHLRVYRVNAAGQVTRVFSTYGREDDSRPARSFSIMIKAGETRPGQERVIAIGSARPLTRDELLSCLRDYLAGGPVESLAPADDAPVAPEKAGTAAVPSLTDALQAVIGAVGRASDLPQAAPAPLERSAWSVTVGRFVSTARRAAQSPTPGSSSPLP